MPGPQATTSGPLATTSGPLATMPVSPRSGPAAAWKVAP